jgi:hypothetical protein
MFAAVAPEPGEATCQDAASEKLTELPLDKEWQRVAAAALARLGKKRLDVIAHYLAQNGALGLPRNVRATDADAPRSVHSAISASRCRLDGRTL